MSDAIVAVLVIPSAGDPGGLLATGRCGATPPVAVLRSCREGHDSWELGVCDDPRCRRARGQLGLLRVLEVDRALPLLWDGALVPEGWDRARRAEDPRGPVRQWVADPGVDIVVALGAALVSAGIAGRVVRLARVDGRLVEILGEWPGSCALVTNSEQYDFEPLPGTTGPTMVALFKLWIQWVDR